VMGERDGRRLLLIDIAVPRDIDSGVRDLPGVTLYDMDDLQREVARNLSGREAEATRARTLVDEEVEAFGRWLASLDVIPTIAALRARGDAIVDQALRENGPRWESLSDADRRRVGALTRAVVSRLLHEPTLRMRRAVGEDDAYLYVQTLRELFDLDPGSASMNEDAPPAPAPAEVTSLEAHRARPRS
jgi:glutamyl-tRNA reductase